MGAVRASVDVWDTYICRHIMNIKENALIYLCPHSFLPILAKYVRTCLTYFIAHSHAMFPLPCHIAPCHASVCVSLCFSLKERQGEWRKEEERRKANAPDPSIPPGHTLMPAAERRKTLDMLKDSECVCVSMHVYMCVCVCGVLVVVFTMCNFYICC